MVKLVALFIAFFGGFVAHFVALFYFCGIFGAKLDTLFM
jgi:hypothetical protein